MSPTAYTFKFGEGRSIGRSMENTRVRYQTAYNVIFW